MPRYEFREGGAKKFWEIALDGSTFTTRYGRIGTPGQELQRDFDSPAQAKRELDRLVGEKLRVGFVLAEDDDISHGGPKRNAELEAAIAAKPDDAAPYLVFADWLQVQGDGRGELIVVQHALESADKTKARELDAREAELIDQHLESWLGGSLSEADAETFDFSWRFGFVRKARLRFQENASLDLFDAITRLLNAPIAALLEELTVGKLDPDGSGDFEDVVSRLVKKKPLLLQAITLKDPHSGGDIGALWPAVPRLRKLRLIGERFGLGDIVAPGVRELALETNGLTVTNISELAAAEWPQLKKLELSVAPYDAWEDAAPTGQCDAPELAPLLEGRNFGAVRYLGLKTAVFADELIEPLASSLMLKHLERLDLSGGNLGEAGVQALLRNKQAFSHLKKLDISDNIIELDDLARLRELCGSVIGDNQRRGRRGGDDRYDGSWE